MEVFEHYLNSHPDRNFAEYILKGLSTGFRVGYSYTRSRKLRSRGFNHPSCLANQGEVAAHIVAEVSAGRLVGPIPQMFHSKVHTSPMGLVPKGHRSGRWRLIVDLSSPHQANVNDGISEDWCSLQYASLDDALRLICHLGPGCQLVKMDLKNAYCIIPVHPDDQHLLGIS